MFTILLLPVHPWHQGVQCGPESPGHPKTNDKQNVQTEIYNDYFGIPIMQYEPSIVIERFERIFFEKSN